MYEETVKLRENKSWPKRIIIAITVVALIIGGSVAAYIYINATPKNKYFQAESSSLDFMKDVFEDQYQPERTWRDHSKEKAVQTSYELSANYEDPTSGFDMFDPATLINLSTITFTTERDKKSKKLSAALNASLGEINVGDLAFYATNEKLLFDLPFLNEPLLLNGDDIGSFLHRIDPKVDSNLDIDLNILFENASKLITDKQREHIEEEYFNMIYDGLDDDYFTSSQEKIEINNESIETEKIKLDLSEKELKNLIEKVIDKMSKDEVLKEMIRELLFQQADLGLSLAPVSSEVTAEINMMMDNYEDTLQKFKNEMNFMMFKDGITSTLWIHKGLIVKRLFEMDIRDEDDFVTLKVDGTQMLNKDEQFFDYDLVVSDNYSSDTVNLTGSFINEGDNSTDSLAISIDDFKVSYIGDESLIKDVKEFDRTLSFEDESNEYFQLTWSGNATYDRDKMNSEHQFSVELAGITDETFALQIAKDSKLIKEVEMPTNNNTKDLGTMDEQELFEYIEYDIPEQFQQWLFGLFGGANFFE